MNKLRERRILMGAVPLTHGQKQAACSAMSGLIQDVHTTNRFLVIPVVGFFA
jgi:hypothetical protein